MGSAEVRWAPTRFLRVNGDAIVLRGFGEEGQIELAVLITEEGLLAVVPPVVEARSDDSRRSGHIRRVPGRPEFSHEIGTMVFDTGTRHRHPSWTNGWASVISSPAT